VIVRDFRDVRLQRAALRIPAPEHVRVALEQVHEHLLHVIVEGCAVRTHTREAMRQLALHDRADHVREQLPHRQAITCEGGPHQLLSRTLHFRINQVTADRTRFSASASNDWRGPGDDSSRRAAPSACVILRALVDQNPTITIGYTRRRARLQGAHDAPGFTSQVSSSFVAHNT
jgi:hypothetical protein